MSKVLHGLVTSGNGLEEYSLAQVEPAWAWALFVDQGLICCLGYSFCEGTVVGALTVIKECS